MTFEQFVQLLEILKWSAVFFVLILIAILLFQAQLAGFLSRVTSIGREGLKAAPAVANQQNQADPNKEAQDVLKALDSPMLLEQEQAIRTQLEKQGIQNAGEKVDLLVRYLAICQLVVTFEETYRLIFGSQIYILKRVNESKVLKRSVVEEHFRHTQKLFPAFTDWDADRYMSFLLTFHLLQYQNEQYAITPFGIEFLTWMARVGAAENKPL
jgi:hypothetical protein